MSIIGMSPKKEEIRIIRADGNAEFWQIIGKVQKIIGSYPWKEAMYCITKSPAGQTELGLIMVISSNKNVILAVDLQFNRIICPSNELY
jgi:hypothetical protein